MGAKQKPEPSASGGVQSQLNFATAGQGGRTEPLEVDVRKLFKEAVLSGDVDRIIREAFEYCKAELQGEPLGLASPVRSMTDLQ